MRIPTIATHAGLLLLIAGMTTMPVRCVVQAEPPEKPRSSGNASKGNASAEEVISPKEQELGKVMPADKLLGTKIEGLDGKALGPVRDLALDLEHGRVAFLMVEVPPQGNAEDPSQGYLAIPPSALEHQKADPHIGTQASWRLGSDLHNVRLADADTVSTAAYHQSLNRGLVEDQYKLFRQQPYWVAKVDPAEPQDSKSKSNADPVNRSYRLTLLSQVAGSKVVDQDGNAIGTLANLALLPDQWQIPYAALQLNQGDANERYPIPLAAFVVENVKQPWEIELSPKIIQDTPHFSSNAWPETLETAWLEYVHVRYGRGLRGGVQHVPHEEGER